VEGCAGVLAGKHQFGGAGRKKSEKKQSGKVFASSTRSDLNRGGKAGRIRRAGAKKKGKSLKFYELPGRKEVKANLSIEKKGRLTNTQGKKG